MIYKQKLTKIGNSVGIIIPKDLRDSLEIGEGSEVFLTESADRKSLIMESQISQKAPSPEFFEMLERVSKEYEDALKTLASN